jgi:D-lactate dehydrogenase (cytochrome)
MPDYSPITPLVAAAIRDGVGPGSVIDAPERLEEFGRDATDLSLAPELVVEATCAAQVQALLRLANRHRFPVTPRGGGTGLAGGALPAHRGVVLSLAPMDSIAIDGENLVAVVGPGALTGNVRQAAKARSLFYPPDPASLDVSTVGGNVATDAGGPACLKYGTTRHYVLGLEAVLPSGELVRAGVRTRKGVVGYSLVHLIAGSEGTLGVITELTLKLIPHPESVAATIAVFPTMEAAMRGVNRILTGGLLPSAIEFLDHRCLALIGSLLPFSGYPASSSLLLIEADGPRDQVARDIEAVRRACDGAGACHLLAAPDEPARQLMWEARRQVSLRIHDTVGDTSGIYVPEDVAVPIARIADLVARLPGYERKHDLTIYAFGHAGDGNIHLNFTAPTEDARPRMEACVHEVLDLVVSMGGTISGEHGIGLAKRAYLPIELSPESIRLQKGIKRLFDPNMILNPGKIFP